VQDSLKLKQVDEINLGEVLITLWAHKLLILFTTALGVILSVYFILNTDKEFTSKATFKSDLGSKNSILPKDLGKLIDLSGGSNNFGVSTLPTDQVTGRIFIETLDKKLNFQADPYFNTYNPKSVDPVWKSFIKQIIGLQKTPVDAQEAMWQSIVANYVTNVELNETPDRSTEIIVTHDNAIRAAEIANVIMNEIINFNKQKKKKDQEQQLNYLSEKLANALNDLEITQFNLKKFTLENSALPLEDFAKKSFLLDGLREKLIETSELHDAVARLLLMLKNKSTSYENYLNLRDQFPIVDQVEFRRVLGQNEIISFWSWPEVTTVAAVLDTLTERISRLKSQINASQIDAERSSEALEIYSKLEREATISKASHTVLIEHVKAQSMLAGYVPDNTEVYEYASASINPSAPNRSLLLTIGAVLGLLLGGILSIILASHRKVYYSKNSLIAAVTAHYTSSASTLMPLRGKSLQDIDTILTKKPRSVLRELAVEVHKSNTNQVVVTSSRGKLTGNDVARALASYMQSKTTKVAIINFSSKMNNLDIDAENLSIGSFTVIESAGNVFNLRPSSTFESMELLSQKDFSKKIQSLHSNIDLLFLCADNTDAISLLSALHEQKPFHITLAKTKQTKSTTLAQMRSRLPIQGLLYD